MLGLDGIDARLDRYVEVLTEAPLAPSHEEIARLVTAACLELQSRERLPVIQLCGPSAGAQAAIALRVASELDFEVLGLAGDRLPVTPEELERVILLASREALLSRMSVLVDCHGVDPADTTRISALGHVASALPCPVFLCGPERRPDGSRGSITFDVPLPTPRDQRALWDAALRRRFDDRQRERLELPRAVEALAGQLRLDGAEIEASALEAAGRLTLLDAPGPEQVQRVLWESARAQSRRRLDALVQRLETEADWDDLVLPDTSRRILEEIELHIRHRTFVHERWGFSGKGWRGAGLVALFHGPSGTGKTLAAEVLASRLRLDLYRIDLSSVLSKYIGDTEKNLRRVFDAAESGAAVLLFDEADALFGKRSEVKDSHDRYANIAVSYLLQRLESFGGLAILTTNLKSALDTAFARRLRFVVGFPFPDRPQREELWRRAFPPSTPTSGLDPKRLSQLNLSGASIRNIALHAAFLASEEAARGTTPPGVRPAHVLEATRQEYLKLQQPLNSRDLEDLS